MILSRFVKRQLSLNGQLLLFILCALVSIVSIVAIGGFGDSVQDSVESDARVLNGGDVIVHGHRPLSDSLLQGIDSLENIEKYTIITEFYSVILANNNSLLVNVKAVDDNYPLYGSVEIDNNNEFSVTNNKAVAELGVFDRLQIGKNTNISLGNTSIILTNQLFSEPDRPATGFALGPRFFVSQNSLSESGLLGTASRAEYDLLIKTNNPQSVVEQLEKIIEHEEVSTYQTRQTGIAQFVNNFLFFLQMVALFILILAGLGLQSTLSSFLQERKNTVGILKVLGSTSKQVIVNYLLVVVIMGLVGIALGVLAGIGLQFLIPYLFQDLLPKGLEQIISTTSIIESVILGLITVVLFTLIPLNQLRHIKPVIILRKQESQQSRSIITIVTVIFLLAGLIYWQISELDIAIYFFFGIIGLVLLCAAIAKALLTLIKKINSSNLVLRQSIRGLFRPRNSTLTIIVTLAVSVAVIFSIFLVEANLEKEFVTSFPPDSPNVFFIDLQSDQQESFKEKIGMPIELYPIVSARITSINQEPVVPNPNERGEPLTREFRLTYRDQLSKTESLLQGDSLFDEVPKGMVPLSILDIVNNQWGITIGDEIVFDIQGVPITAKVTSIRAQEEDESFSPFFYYVFPKEVLQDAPQTIFAATRIPDEEISSLQTRMVQEFPNLAVIDLSQTIKKVSELLSKLTRVIQVFNGFSVIAGLLILISSILATRVARTQEAVYFKILGAKNRFIKKVFLLESALVGIIASMLGILIAQVGSWLIVSRVLKVDYELFLIPSFLTVLILTSLVVFLAYLTSISILKEKPINFLRKQDD